MSELLYRVAITKVSKVGAIISKNLISHCGSAEAVFKASKRELMSVPNVGETIANNIQNPQILKWAESELLFLEKNNIKALFYTDKEYPLRLKQIYDCPTLIYYKGSVDLNYGRVVSVVGTRKPSPYGVRLTEEFVEGLQKYNVLIVSGLAFGIDITAHRKSLDLSIPNIGVLGNGLQRIYPHQHKEIAHQMCANGGLLTEYPSDQDPDKEHFPMRNRIIAGMTDALVVVETAAQGGSMITAYMAAGYDKELFAIPGRAGDKMSKGCNNLIKEHKASLIESADDLAFVMRWDELDKRKNIQTQLFPELTENEHIIVNILKKSENGALIDTLSYESQLSHTTIAGLLLELEFKGVIKSLPGKRYTLN